MKESNQVSRDLEDDTDLDIDGIEDAVHFETEIVESVGSLGLRSRFSCDPEDDTDLDIDGIEDAVHLELETVDVLLEQEQQGWIDIVIKQGSQDRIDAVLERRSQSQDTRETEDGRSHVR